MLFMQDVLSKTKIVGRILNGRLCSCCQRYCDKLNPYKHKFVVIGLFAIILVCSISTIAIKGFNKGIDFSGGIVVEVSCYDCNADKISKELSNKIGSSVSHQAIDGGYIFKTSLKKEDADGKNYDKTLEVFKNVFNESKYKQNRIVINGTNYVSAQMSSNFVKDAINACLFAFICIGIYMMVRFNWKFAIAGIFAIMYDVLIVMGFISFMQVEVCLITLTAILTIIGYCINDKIVVFDRIRSNLQTSNTSLDVVITDSVKSVLTRSLLTSITTIVMAMCLLFFGDKGVYEFAITIYCGIIIGTLSSILLAPVLVLFLKVSKKPLAFVKDPMFYAS